MLTPGAAGAWSGSWGYISAALCAAAQSFAAAPSAAGYPGPDGHGRPRDLHYISGDSGAATLAHHEYAYDGAGNRTAVRTRPAASVGPRRHREKSF